MKRQNNSQEQSFQEPTNLPFKAYTDQVFLVSNFSLDLHHDTWMNLLTMWHETSVKERIRDKKRRYFFRAKYHLNWRARGKELPSLTLAMFFKICIGNFNRKQDIKKQNVYIESRKQNKKKRITFSSLLLLHFKNDFCTWLVQNSTFKSIQSVTKFKSDREKSNFFKLTKKWTKQLNTSFMSLYTYLLPCYQLNVVIS